MKILIHDYAGHPFAVQLSRSVANRGHDVLHVYSSSNTMPRGVMERASGDHATFEIKGISVGETIQKSKFLKRRRQEIEHGLKVAAEIRAFRPDVVMSANTPLDAQASIWKACRSLRIAHVFWLQDMIGIATDVILRKRLPVAGAGIGRYYIKMEERLLRQSSAIVAITNDFVPLLRRIGVEEDKIHLQENWGPLEEFAVEPRVNPWALRQGYDETFNFIYSGSLGMKHNPRLLLDLAKSFESHKEVRVIVITEGATRPWLERKRAEMNLKNLDILDYQPYDQMSNVMASADVLVAILEPSAGIFSVPSKVLSCLCGGRALLLAVPEENLAAKIVSTAGAGLISPPTSSDGFVADAQTLYESASLREKMGASGRSYAERTFDIDRVTDRFLGIFEECAAQTQHSFAMGLRSRSPKKAEHVSLVD